MRTQLRTILMALMMVAATMAIAHVEDGDYHNQDGYMLDHNTIFAHLHMGGGYTTSLSFLNPGTGQDVSGTVYFYNQDGTPMTVTIEGSDVTEWPVTVVEGGLETVELGDPADDTLIGWALFVNDASEPDPGDHQMRMGDHLFTGIFYKRYNDQGESLATQVGVTGMRFTGGMHRGYGMLVRNDAHSITGLAMVNSSESNLTADLTLKNPDGTLFAETSVELAPGQQVVDVLSGYFDGVDGVEDFLGTLEIRSDDDGIVPLGLVNTDGIQTAIPLMMIPDAEVHDHGGMGGM